MNLFNSLNYFFYIAEYLPKIHKSPQDVRTDFSPIPDANPQVTEKAGSAMAAVYFSRPLVPSEFLQLAQAVGE